MAIRMHIPYMVRVDRALAVKMQSMPGAPGDRPLSEFRLSAYKKMLEKGLFRSVDWATAFCEETQMTYRVNGKHTSTMLCQLEEIPKDFHAKIEEADCDTLQDVAEWYSTFDSKLQTRTVHGIYIAFLRTLPQLDSVSEEVGVGAIRGMAYHELGQERHTNVPAAERAELVLMYPEFVLWYSDFLSRGDMVIGSRSKKKAPHLRAQPIVAAIFGTWLKRPKPASGFSAEAFWSKVRDQSGVNPKSPDRTLSQYLLATPITTDNRYEVYYKCIQAWNSYRREDERLERLIYRPDNPPPRIM